MTPIVPTDSAVRRFWPKVKKSSGCWLWTGGRDTRGYGMFSLNGRGSAPVKAHRFSWVLARGPLRDGEEVCHACDNPPCCNPDHLFVGSHKENMLDASQKGRLRVRSKGRSGSRNNMAVLDEAKVLEIRRRRAAGETNSGLGRAFGVDRTCISLIVRGKKWKHVGGPICN